MVEEVWEVFKMVHFARNELRVTCAHLLLKVVQNGTRCQIGSNWERGAKESD